MSSINKWFCLPLLTALLVACGGSDDPYGRRTVDISDTVALKMSPVSADSPAFSILVDSTPDDGEAGSELDDLVYGQVATFGVTPGSVELTVRSVVPEGAGQTATHEDLLVVDLDTTGGNRYEVFFAGSYPDIDYWVTETPLEYAEDDTQARLTMVNASTTVPSMDVYLIADGESIDSSVPITTLASEASDNSIRVDEGDYQIMITEAGSPEVIYTSPTLSFGARMDLSLVAMDNAWIKPGLTGKPPIVLSRSGASGNSGLLFSVDTGSDLRAVNAWSTGGPLDITTKPEGDVLVTPLATDFQPGAVVPFQTFVGGTYTINIGSADSTADFSRNFNLMNGVAWTMVVTAPEPEETAPTVMLVSENARSIAAYSRLRIMHTSGAAGNLDIYITGQGADLGDENAEGGPLYTPLATGFPVRSTVGYMAVESGSYDIILTETVPEGETAPDVPEIVYRIPVTFDAGGIYSLLLLDEATQPAHQWLDGAPEAATTP